MFPFPTPLLAAGQSAGGPTDPYWANVVLLCGFNGTDGATSFTDESPIARALTANGNVQIDTADKKFGASSLLCDGTANDFVSAVNSADFQFGTGQWTVELWAKWNVTLGAQCLIAYGDGGSNGGWYLRHSSTGNSLTCGFRATTVNGTWVRDTSAWHHFAVDRDASLVIRVYLDGVMVGSGGAAAGSGGSTGRTLKIGQEDTQTSSSFTGWIDEVRITKGVARYASDSGFAVPSAAYPRS